MKATLCSRNRHKARELEQLLPGWEIRPLAAADYPPETGETYYENARAKAAYGRTVAGGGDWTIGEDSGLEVEALGGRPGIGSARYAPEGAPAIAKLLAELGDAGARAARYVCELVAISPEGVEVRGSGALEGRIAAAPSGAGGFGYDPVFVPDGESRSVAELGDAWKTRNSHRARAARAMLAAIGLALALVLAGCGGDHKLVNRLIGNFYARNPLPHSLSPVFPHRPGSLPCVLRSRRPTPQTLQATCSIDVSLVKHDRAVITLTEAWNHGAQAHTWFFFVRSDGTVQSVVQEGAVAPQARR
ncbi:MAG: non-canonical purine NTP pyrophosphatase [Gaiellaceae bacterium]